MMVRRVGVTSVVALLVALVPAAASAAPVPFEPEWREAADAAHVAATPAPSELAGFGPMVQLPGALERAIDGRDESGKGALAACPRWRRQSTAGYFERLADNASLIVSYELVPRKKACRFREPPRDRKLIGHLKVLGVRMGLYRLPGFEPSESSYLVSGRGRGWRFFMQTAYRGSHDAGETVRIAQGMRWLRRPGKCAPGVAAQHKLARARELMSHERHATFSFPSVPGLGAYVHEIFIGVKHFEIGGNIAGDVIATAGDVINRFPGAKLVVHGKGDGREHARDFDPRRVRAFVVLDLARGSGYLVSNHSTVRIQAKIKPGVVGPTFTKTLYNRSFTARDVTPEWQGGNNWVDAAWVTPDTFRLRYGLRASGPGGTLIMNTIDHQLLIDRRTGTVTFEGDRFPSTGTYRIDCAGKTHTMHRQVEAELGNLGDDPVFSHDAPVTGIQPGSG